MVLLALFAMSTACTDIDEPRRPPTGSGVATASTGATSFPDASYGAGPGARGFAQEPDRGELVVYPPQASVRREGAYTWNRVGLSEAHALAAIGSGRLQVKTPSGQLLGFRYRRHVEHPSGDWTWIGALENGAEGEETILTFGEKATFGSIAQPGKEPLLLAMRAGASWLVETDRSLLALIDNSATRPRAPDFFIPPKSATRQASSSSSGVGHAGSTAIAAGATPAAAGTARASTVVDVVLGYTSGFAQGLGGQSQAVTRLNHLMAVTNEAYVNSQIDAEVRLVHAMQVDYPDATDNGTALEELTGFRAPSTRTTPAAAFAGLRAARNQYGADLVSLVRKFNEPENSGCGIAWLIGGNQTGIDQSDESFGYSVVSDGTDAGADGKTYFCREETLAHEFGHNMGSQHDRAAATIDGVLKYGVYPYSFGFKAAVGAGNFYTVMAYGDKGQPRYRGFSNPRTTCSGGFACGLADSADNARSLAQTMPTIAAFRAMVVPYPALPAPTRAKNDFNADGRSDIVWHNPGLQQLDLWLMNGGARQGVESKGISSQYEVAATGDFNGDGRGDILWRDQTRTTIWIWQANASGVFDVLFVRAYPPAGWEVVGAADVNADGRSDILWHNVGAQQMDWWLMDGATLQAVGSKGISNQYRVAAVGDFNGDGRGDILWRDESRTSLWIWQAEASGAFSILFVRPYPASSWNVVGAADVNADGRSDILWHNVDQQQMDWWVMDGAALQAVGSKGIPSQYRVSATGDFNGDGRGDIVWHDEGRTTLWIWQAEATGGFSIVFLAAYPPPSWNVVGF